MDSPSSSSSLPKLCFMTGATVDSDFGHNLYIVDLNSNESSGGYFSYLAPKAQLHGEILTSSVFCVLGSTTTTVTLYVFKQAQIGYNIIRSRVPDFIYRYELSILALNLRLDDSMLVRVCAMKDRKFNPIVIPTLDGKKIVVCSSLINSTYDERKKRIDFELFDPNGGRRGKGVCHKLPQLIPQLICSGEKTEFISYAAFINNKTLVVALRRKYFSLNIEAGECWEPFYDFYGRVSYPIRTCFDFVGGEICLIPGNAFDIHVNVGVEDRQSLPPYFFSYPDLYTFAEESEIQAAQFPIALGDCKFCIVHAGTREVEPYLYTSYCIPHYNIDVYSCDLDEFIKFREKKEEEQVLKKGQPKKFCELMDSLAWPDTFLLPGATKLKSLQFCLNKDLANMVHCHSVSVIPPLI